MGLAIPRGMRDRLAGVSAVRWLLLMAVWGVAVFLWGTFGAWTEQRYLEQERTLARPYAAQLAAALVRQANLLDTLHNDTRLADGIGLPAGVESLPIQRVLYEFAYLNRISDVYVVDLLRGKSGRTAGAAPLPKAALERLKSLTYDAPTMLMGVGQSNAVMLLLRNVEAPLPHRLFAAVPVGLSSIASGLPRPPASFGERTATLVLPHPDGWARWDMSTTKLDFPEDLQGAMDTQSLQLVRESRQIVLLPLEGLPDVSLAMEGPYKLVSTALLPRLLVLLWAVAMSLLILWQDETFQKVRDAGAQKLAPLTRALTPLGTQLGRLGALLPLESFVKAWHEARDTAPLVEPSDDVDMGRFRDLPKRTLSNAKPRKPLLAAPAPAEIAAAHAGGGGVPKLERRTRGRGSAVMGMPAASHHPHAAKAKPAWAASASPLPKSTAPDSEVPTTKEPELDEEDLLEVVKDCLRKKRIKLMYQPVYRAADNMPVMHEVFARLVKRDGTVLSPAEFLPLATRHRLTLELDLTVLRKVVHEHFGGGQEPLTPLAVNISSSSLDGIAYLQEMASQGPRVLRKMGFEVRSQEMIRDPKALKLLKDLQKHGGNLAVDYFGGGEAMLDASKSIGFNYVKLDSSRFMDTDEGKKNLIKLCRYASQIGLPIILEKVGHIDTEDFGRKAGAQFLQGYALKSPEETLTTEPLQLFASQIASLPR